MSVRFIPITRQDVVPLHAVRVHPDQDDFIAPNAITIAQVRFQGGGHDFCIWDDDIRVGLLAIIDNAHSDTLEGIDHPDAVYIWRLLIGAEHQRKGYGAAALRFAENWARRQDKALVQVQAVETNGAAIAAYQKTGYVLTGKRAGEAIQLEKWL